MNYSITHEEFREEIKIFFEDIISPNILSWEQEQSVPLEIFRELGNRNLLGLTIPTKDGGRGLDISYTLVLVEEFLKHNAVGIAASLLIQLNTVTPLLARHGNDYIKEHFLTPLIKGESIGSLAVTEPSGGSDLLNAIKCTAEKHEDKWVLNGEKKFITNSPIADKLVVLAKTKDSNSPLSMTLFAVDARGEGYKVEQLFKISQKSSPVGHITFENYEVPLSNVVGRVNKGYLYAAEVLDEERFIIGYGAIILAEAAIKKTIEHLSERYFKGQAIINNQAIRHELAVFISEIEGCKSLVRKVSDSIVNGDTDKARAAIVKYHLCDVAQKIVQRCHQLFGSLGLYENTWIDRAVRDVRILSIYAGSSETMKDIGSFKLIPNLYK